MLRLLSIVFVVLTTTIITSASAQAETVSVQPAAAATAISFTSGRWQPRADGFDHIALSPAPEMGRTCLKLRAFIFETNDDRVPRFVRETTCLSTGNVHARHAEFPVEQPDLASVSK